MRIFLFILTNILVIATLSIVTHLLGVDRYLTAQGFNWTQLIGFALIWGMGGSFISLMMSRWMARFSTGARVIETPQTEMESWLVNTVARQCQAAGLPMPQVAIYPGGPNAFATGPSKHMAMVAVSDGLLAACTRSEVEAILAHEVSHIANGDMVTMALLQGVVNAMGMFLSRVVAYFIDRVLLRNEEEPGLVYHLSVLVLDILFTILGSLLVMWFSRHREFRADAGAAGLVGAPSMIAALRRLSGDSAELPQNVATMGLAGKPGWLALFSTHPSMEARIAALSKIA